MQAKPKHYIEFCLAWPLIAIMRCLPLRLASFCGAGFGAFMATLPTKANATARANIKKIYPKKTKQEVRKLQFAASKSMARTFFEMAPTYKLSEKQFNNLVKVDGLDNFTGTESCLILTAHLGNWELILKAAGVLGLPFGNIYRRANNPLVDSLITQLRAQPKGLQIPKGSKGARALIKAIKGGMRVGFLNDQKLNDGIEAEFLGHKCMCPPALAELALKYNRKVVPAFCVRKPNGNFELTFDEPIDVSGKTVEEATNLFNEIIAGKIRAHPEQWMWFHKRF